MKYHLKKHLSNLSMAAILAVGLSQPVLGSAEEFERVTYGTPAVATVNVDQTGARSLYLDRFMRFVDDIEARVEIFTVRGRTHNGKEFTYVPEHNQLRVGKHLASSSQSKDLQNMRNIFGEFHELRADFTKSFFERLRAGIMTQLVQSQIDRYGEKGLLSQTRGSNNNRHLNDRFAATVQLIEGDCSQPIEVQLGLPEDFDHGDQGRLKHLDVVLRGEGALRSSITAAETEKVKHTAFKSIFGDLLDPEADIVDVNLFPEREAQVRSLVARLKLDFVEYLINPQAYKDETKGVLAGLADVEGQMRTLGGGMMTSAIIDTSADELFVASYLSDLPEADVAEASASVATEVQAEEGADADGSVVEAAGDEASGEATASETASETSVQTYAEAAASAE